MPALMPMTERKKVITFAQFKEGWQESDGLFWSSAFQISEPQESEVTCKFTINYVGD